MKRRKNSKLMLGLLLAVIGLGIGYAAIAGVNLLVNGTASVKSSDGNFAVRFVRNDANETAIENPVENAITIVGHNADDTLMDISGMSASIEDDTHATFEAGELDEVGEYVEFTYMVVNESDRLDAALAFDVEGENDAEDYFEITKTVSKDTIAVDETATVTVKVELIATPKVEDALVTFTVTLGAVPLDNSSQTDNPVPEPVSRNLGITPEKMVGETYEEGQSVIFGEEPFFVLSDDGTEVKLIARYNLNKAGTAQLNATYQDTAVAFSTSKVWIAWNNATRTIDQVNPPADATAIKAAIAYGSSKGAVGRLLTDDEYMSYRYDGSDKIKLILRGTDYDSEIVGSDDKTKTIDNYLNYWTNQANVDDDVNGVTGENAFTVNIKPYYNDTTYGVRPILIVS